MLHILYFNTIIMPILENIEVRKKAVQLAKNIYDMCKNNSYIKNDYGIRDQLQRSAVSIASNIAEWNDRETDKEFIRFLYIARGSCSELKTQLFIIENLLDKKIYNELLEQTTEIHKMLNKFIQKIKSDI